MKGLILKFIDTISFEEAKLDNKPFRHLVLDNFLGYNYALSLSKEFNEIPNKYWYTYNNEFESKRSCNNMSTFGKNTHEFFSYMNSDIVLKLIGNKFGYSLIPDMNLYGAGMFSYPSEGKLLPHLDAAFHPDTKNTRVLTFLLFLSENYDEKNGGKFGLYDSRDSSHSGRLIKEISPNFNSAICFDNFNLSWHGLTSRYICQENQPRKVLSLFYYSKDIQPMRTNERALFSTPKDKLQDEKIQSFIRNRAMKKIASSSC